MFKLRIIDLEITAKGKVSEVLANSKSCKGYRVLLSFGNWKQFTELSMDIAVPSVKVTAHRSRRPFTYMKHCKVIGLLINLLQKHCFQVQGSYFPCMEKLKLLTERLRNLGDAEGHNSGGSRA